LKAAKKEDRRQRKEGEERKEALQAKAHAGTLVSKHGLRSLISAV
jgi:hypothetical protein